MTDDYSYDDDGFTHYEATTVDPGPSILVSTALFCLLLYCGLPFVVALCNRIEAWKQLRNDKKNDTLCSEDEERQPGSGGGGQASAHAYPNDDRSLASASSATSTASAVLGVLLDAAQEAKSPGRRGGTLGGRRPKRGAALQREHAETQVGTAGIPSSGHPEGQSSPDDQSVWSLLEAPPGSVEPTASAPGPLDKGHATPATTNDAESDGVCRASSRSWRNLPAAFSRTFEKLLSIVELDYETKRIYKLALPYVLQALVSGIAWNGILVIIGQLLGTRQVSAYAVVDLLVGLTAEAVGGIAGSLVTLLGFSRGTNNAQLTGQYLQMAIILYTLCSIPFILMWWWIIDPVMRLFGFDAITASMGLSFVKPYAVSRLLRGITRCVHCVMDVFDLAFISTLVVGAGEIASTVAVLLAALYWNPSLEAVGFIFLLIEFLMLFGSISLVAFFGWFRPFYGGLFHTFALKNTAALKLMLKTSSSLTAGYLLTYGEWEILALFAGFLGPAEVAAWSMLGTLWGAVELGTFAVGDASEVRVALLLGSGKPQAAKKSAYKSIFIAFVFSLFSTSIIFIAGDDLPTWLTTDPVLQGIIAELMPLFGIGNIAMTMGSMAWTLVGAQNRYRLATAIGIAGSWFITIPMSALLSVVYRIDLQGQTAAVVIGYMISGFVTNVILLRSDWKKLSDKVVLDNMEADVLPLESEESGNFEEEEQDIASSSPHSIQCG